MAFPSTAALTKQAIQDTVDLVAVDGLPEDPVERLNILRFLAKSDTWVPTHCPETGVSLEGLDIVALADSLWPSGLPYGSLSADARDREAALFRAAGRPAPHRR